MIEIRKYNNMTITWAELRDASSGGGVCFGFDI